MMRPFALLERKALRGLEEFGFAGALLGESLYWTLFGRAKKQPVRLTAILGQMIQTGIEALPIATMLSATIGVMLALQSLYTLGLFGAESFATVGIGLAVTREFAPLIIGILIAGRSGSALAARLSAMLINQEVDALRVIGISPIRFLVTPALLAMVVVVPCLTMWANVVALTAAGVIAAPSLDLSLQGYFAELLQVVSVHDLWHGLTKSLIFAAIIAVIASLNGAMAEGGAEGVGRRTTRAVVQSIATIIVTDMIFAYIATAG